MEAGPGVLPLEDAAGSSNAGYMQGIDLYAKMAFRGGSLEEDTVGVEDGNVEPGENLLSAGGWLNAGEGFWGDDGGGSLSGGMDGQGADVDGVEAGDAGSLQGVPVEGVPENVFAGE